MNSNELVDVLVGLPDLSTQHSFLDEKLPLLNDEVARLLKQQADHFLRVDIQHSLNISDLLQHIANLTRNQLYEALGLLVEANARSIGLGEYERAIALYNEAAEIYRIHERPAEQARSQVGKVNALAYLGRFEEALEAGRWAGPILEAHQLWYPLITLTMNLGIVHGRRGEELLSLQMFDRAADLYKQMGVDGETGWALIQQNRAVSLRNVGRFAESINASQLSHDMLARLGELVEAARAEQGLALTYFVLGRFNEALDILDRVRGVFLDDGRLRDAMLVELYISDCLLQLRRFPDVIEKCRFVRGLFAEIGTRQVEALAIINEAVAFVEMRQFDQALLSLSEARRIFSAVGNDARVASTDLEKAAVLLCLEQPVAGLALAGECIHTFRAQRLPIEEAQALLVAARAALAIKDFDQVQGFLSQAFEVGSALNIPTVMYQSHALKGALAHAQGDLATAQAEFERAIQDVEQLRGRLMVEFRVSFLENKEALYQDMVDVCLEQGQLLRGLEFAERAKSRALLDLLAYRLDLTIQARNAEDLPLVNELTRLRSERDQLYRRWESDSDSANNNERGWSSSQSLRQKAQQEVLALEKQITEIWHRLLIHNADYVRDADLWTVRTESPQPYLASDTLLVEYFVVHGKLIAFLLTREDVRVVRLTADLESMGALLKRLQLNLRTAPKSPATRLKALTENARGILEQFYDALIAPLERQVARYPNLIIVPHGVLHYVPFHALYDGAFYLLERHEISYLPNASSLRYCQEAPRSDTTASLVMGYSQNGWLPNVVVEARTVAAILGGTALEEEQATRAEFYRQVADCRTLHLAAHGDFRIDNPLFSGLVLADGWLTTMDIFNMRLQASLVTLSACQTGRNVIGGGDELLGLMRAFIGAGAASVVLTLWAVEDRSTAVLMEAFYRQLANGQNKSAALRAAQLQCIQTEGAEYAHPYFWAPFFLVGDTGKL